MPTGGILLQMFGSYQPKRPCDAPPSNLVATTTRLDYTHQIKHSTELPYLPLNQQLLPRALLPLRRHLPTGNAPAIAHANNLVNTLLARPDTKRAFLRALRLRLEHGPTPPEISTRVRELKRRLARELERNLHLAAFVDIRLDVRAACDMGARQRVDSLRDAAVGDDGAAVRGRVGHSGDDESAGVVGDTREERRRAAGPPLLALPLVEDCEGRGAAEAERQPVADAVVFFGLEWNYGWRVVDGDLDAWGEVRWCRSYALAPARVAHFADGNVRVTVLAVLWWNLQIVGVFRDAGDADDFGFAATGVLEFDFKVKGWLAGENDRDAIF